MKNRIIRAFALIAGVLLLVAVQLYIKSYVKNDTPHQHENLSVSASDTVPELTPSDISFSDISFSDIPTVTVTDISSSNTDISAEDTNADLNQYAIVSVKSAAVRKSASSSSSLIKYLKKGTKVIVLERSGKWYRISFNEKVGWIYYDCIDLIRNRELEATLYSPVPEQIPGEILSLGGTATAHHINNVAADQHADGVTVAVISNGQVAYHYEYGYSDLSHKTKTTQNTKFRVASLSKVFTAMLAMKLVEDNKLDLDADFGKYYGKTIRNPRHKNTPITTRMLLSHTSSFKDKEPIFSGSFYRNLEDKSSYSTSRPGYSFRYSNFGMGVAGAVVEKRSGMVLSRYADSVFFSDMGIDAAYDGRYLDDKSDIADCIKGSKMGLSAADVVKNKTEYDPGYNYSLGAGGLIITAVDMAKLTCILANYGTYDGKRYLNTETVEQMFTKQYNTNGFDQCIALRRSKSIIPGRTVYYHTGSAYGIFAMMVFDPSDASGVIVLSTGAADYKESSGARTVCSEIVSLVYEDIFDFDQ